MNENNPIVYSVIEKLHKQQEKGLLSIYKKREKEWDIDYRTSNELKSLRHLKKYGVEVKTSSHDLKGWLQHGLEETLDLATYLETAIQLLEEQEQAFQARYDFHISKKYEAMAGFYEGWSSSADARNHHALSASLVYQDALTAGFKLKAEGE